VGQGELRGVVALDGPSGTGKSTVARRVAALLRAAYLDTGAMYRAATLAVLRAGADLADEAVVAERVAEATIEVGSDPERALTLLDGDDVAAEIRGPEVTAAVSAVSAVPRVREMLVAHQQRIIDEACVRLGGIVVEGRDIGTVVAPSAELKLYLTASPDVRAQRRTRQDAEDGRTSTVDGTRADVDRRDWLDSNRAASPLRPAEDAVELDTTELDLQLVVDRVMAMVNERRLRVPSAVNT
jgi:cytidylate kinase